MIDYNTRIIHIVFCILSKVLNINIMRNNKYLPINNKNPLPNIENVTNIETKKDAQILPASWDPADRNTSPPPTINTFKNIQWLLRESFVKKKKVIHQ